MPPASRRTLCPGAWLELWPRVVTEHEAAQAELTRSLPLATEHYLIAGRRVRSPRLVSWHGDPEAAYRYSGSHHEPQPWTPLLLQMRHRVEEVCSLQFNAVLVNLYRDGNDSMGWHADDEPVIGPDASDRWVASLSFGAPRRFVLRSKRDKQERHEFSLGDGDLLVMRGTTQSLYHHALPKTKLAVGTRMNLTFRHIVTRGAPDARPDSADRE